jgi:hypothetical protein
MVIFLLAIIAVGVLLLSAPGRGLLDIAFKIAVVAGIAYIGFWIVVGGVALVSSYWTAVLPYILGAFAIYAIYLGNKFFNDKLGSKEKRRQVLAKWWEKSKVSLIGCIVLLLIAVLYAGFEFNQSLGWIGWGMLGMWALIILLVWGISKLASSGYWCIMEKGSRR